MARHHPAPRAEILVSAEIHGQLLTAAMNTVFEKETWEIAAEAIDEWTRRHNPDALPGPAYAGYHWKGLFLPNGTVLRTIFGGKNHHCNVEGDAIHYEGKPISPSGFVNAVGGLRRNAWNCAWIPFPESKDWKLARTLRGDAGASRSRKPRSTAAPAAGAQPAKQPHSHASPPVSPPDMRAPAVASAMAPADIPEPPVASVATPRRQRRDDAPSSLSAAPAGTDRRIRAPHYDRVAASLQRHLLPLPLLLLRVYKDNLATPAPMPLAGYAVEPTYYGAGLRYRAT